MGLLDSFRTRLSRQLSGPSGRGGRIVAALMNRGNRKMNLAALELLGVDAGARVLELGFGGGRNVDELLDRDIEVAAVDTAAEMAAALRARRAADIGAGRLVVEVGGAEDLPLSDDSLDGAVTINTVYFWPALEPGLAELRRTLRPGATLVIGIRDGAVMTNVDRSIFTIRTPEQIATAATAAGFTETRIESPSDQEVHFIVAR